jgi:hypothetical protein
MAQTPLKYFRAADALCERAASVTGEEFAVNARAGLELIATGQIPPALLELCLERARLQSGWPTREELPK